MSTLDDTLDELGAFLKDGARAPEAARIRACLAHRNNCVVASAASCAAKHALADLRGVLVAAWSRFAENGVKTDKGCVAKKSLVKALDRLGHDDHRWFAAASTCVQIEPAYGGPVDTAVGVRCAAAHALSRFPWYHSSKPLVKLLGDPSPQARLSAIEVVSAYEGSEPEMVLLTKTVAGDSSEEVMGACFRSLLVLDQAGYLDLVGQRLHQGPEEARLEAALALGGTHSDRALELLREAWDDAAGVEKRRSLLLAISMLRTAGAAAFLAGVRADRRYANIAAEALAAYPASLTEGLDKVKSAQ